MSMIQLLGAITQSPSAPVTFSMSNAAISYSVNNGLTCYAEVRFATDGDQYVNGTGLNSTANVLQNTYRTGGSGADYWIERTIDVGSLDQDEIGATRKQMNIDYTTGIQYSGGGTGGGSKTATVTFSIYDAASSGNLMDQVTIVFTATESSI